MERPACAPAGPSPAPSGPERAVAALLLPGAPLRQLTPFPPNLSHSPQVVQRTNMLKDIQGRILVHESTDDGVRAGQYAFGTAKARRRRLPPWLPLPPPSAHAAPPPRA